MEDINSVMIVGRLTRNAEMRYTEAGTAVCSFSIASNYRKKVGGEWTDEVNFFDAVMFGKRAEGIGQYLNKGKQVAISGTLKQDRWEQDGAKRSKVVITVNSIQLIGGKDSAETGSEWDDDIAF